MKAKTSTFSYRMYEVPGPVDMGNTEQNFNQAYVPISGTMFAPIEGCTVDYIRRHTPVITFWVKNKYHRVWYSLGGVLFYVAPTTWI